jgi:hypothetical protein
VVVELPDFSAVKLHETSLGVPNDEPMTGPVVVGVDDAGTFCDEFSQPDRRHVFTLGGLLVRRRPGSGWITIANAVGSFWMVRRIRSA